MYSTVVVSEEVVVLSVERVVVFSVVEEVEVALEEADEIVVDVVELVERLDEAVVVLVVLVVVLFCAAFTMIVRYLDAEAPPDSATPAVKVRLPMSFGLTGKVKTSALVVKLLFAVEFSIVLPEFVLLTA